MVKLSGTHIFLRAVEPEDLDFLYMLENSEDVWEVSHTIAPYSRFVLKEYLMNSHKDIYEVKQLRLAICSYTSEVYGLVDLYNFDPKNKRAGIGVIIANQAHRNKGLATEALQLVMDYAFEYLDLHQLYVNITEDNLASIRLFYNLGFKQSGVKKDWNYVSGIYKDEILYQKINK